MGFLPWYDLLWVFRWHVYPNTWNVLKMYWKTVHYAFVCWFWLLRVCVLPYLFVRLKCFEKISNISNIYQVNSSEYLKHVTRNVYSMNFTVPWNAHTVISLALYNTHYCSEMHLFTTIHNNVYAVASVIWFKLQDLATLCNRRIRTLILGLSTQKLFTLT